MNSISVVIITHNEESNIVDCIRSARLVSDDIIVVDAGSNDDTIQRAQIENASSFSVNWKGYGSSRNFGASKAKNNWILALDADERISLSLAAAIKKIRFSDPAQVYKFRRENYIGQQKIIFGTLGFETVTRIYNRLHSSWDLTLVHEKLKPVHSKKELIQGHLIHYGLKNFDDYKNKAILYARMSAKKYFLEGKKTNWLKKFSSPLFNSIKSYIFQLGFLEGKKGWRIARTIAYYSHLKYVYLHQISSGTQSKEVELGGMVEGLTG